MKLKVKVFSAFRVTILSIARGPSALGKDSSNNKLFVIIQSQLNIITQSW